MPDQPSITLPIGDYNQMVKDSALLRQQNDALVEALRDALAWKHLPDCKCSKALQNLCRDEILRRALAAYAPADAPEEEQSR